MSSNDFAVWTRRRLTAALGAGAVTALAARLAQAQSAVLPVRATDLDHFGITVGDSIATAEFFGRIFDQQLFREMDSPTRLYVKLGTAHMAIGNRAYWTREPVDLPVLDHVSARVEDYDQAKLEKALTDAGIVLGAGRGFPLDPDGLFLQLGAAPGGMSRTIIPAARISHDDPIVQVMGVDHIMVAATDLQRSDAFYRLIFGAALRTSDRDRLWYAVGPRTRLGVQRVASGEQPSFHHFALRVSDYDRRDATRKLESLGAEIVDSGDEGLLRFRDPNGITVELKAG